jgi:monoamine oxidase
MGILFPMASDVDVIVIGAGVAGLSAAACLRSAGRSCAVLEAGGRTGGRVVTTNLGPLGEAFDHGASWLHAAERNPLAEIARQHGDGLVNSSRARTRRILVDGRPASSAELAEYAAAYALVIDQAGQRAAQLPDIAFADALAGLRDNPWTATIEMWEACLIAAADPRDFSLQDWRANELTGSNLMVKGGLGRFVQRVLAQVAGPVVLNAPVSRIGWGRRITADTPQGRVCADACIVTVSTGVLARGGIAFDPPLPERTQAALHGLPMGLLTKVALPATGADRLGIPDDTALTRRIARDEPGMSFICWQSGSAYIVGFVGGPAAWDLARAGAAATEDFARSELRRMLGNGVFSHLGAAVVTDWADDPAQRGAYAYARPGHAGARAALAAPLEGGRLAFAGEATCTDGLAGTVGGAWIAGRDAALRMLEDGGILSGRAAPA